MRSAVTRLEKAKQRVEDAERRLLLAREDLRALQISLLPTHYFAAVVDGFHSRSIVVRASPEEILEVPIKGNNPRVFRVPSTIVWNTWDADTLCSFIKREDAAGAGIPIGG